MFSQAAESTLDYTDRVKLLFVLLLICVPLPARADEILFIGGGSERRNPVNFFDVTMQKTAILSHDLQIPSAFVTDTEHPATKKFIQANPGIPMSPFNDQFTDASIDALIARIQSPETKPGAKVLLIVETHGFQGSDGRILISTANSAIDIEDRLKKVISVANAKGVKIAVVMGNCYSGTLLQRLDPQNRACLISVSAPNRLGYADFSPALIDKLRSGNDLETAFLEERRKYLVDDANKEAVGLPQISTEAGVTALRQMAVISRHRFHPIDRLRAFSDQKTCDEDLKQIEALRATAKFSTTATEWAAIEPALKRFRLSVKTFGLNAKELKKRAEAVSYLSTNITSWCGEHFSARPAELLKWKLTDQQDYCTALQQASDCANEGSQSSDAKCGMMRMKTLLKDPLFSKRANLLARSFADTETELEYDVLVRRFAEKVLTIKEERQIYDALYRAQGEVLKNLANPCRDFKFSLPKKTGSG